MHGRGSLARHHWLKRSLASRGYGSDATRIPTAVPDAAEHEGIARRLARIGS